MPELTPENVEAILATLAENAAGLSECLTQCFDVPFQIRVGESGGWLPEELPAPFAKAGLVTMFEVGSAAAAVLIPVSLPIPGWYTAPNESQKSRLQTLAMEWSMNLFPAEIEPGKSITLAITELSEFISDCAPADWAATVQLDVTNGEGQPTTPLLMVWPLTKPQYSAGVFAPAPPITAPKATGPISTAGGRSIGGDAAKPAAAPLPTPPAPLPGLAPVDPLARLRFLPVQISVRLAEKKIPVSQLLTIAPGTLITFSKSCEDLLDMYVNNALYCRGEAVKIGENFGLKINEVNAVRERVSKILQ